MNKAILSLIGMVLSVSLYAQTYKSGDATLDANLKSITVEANKDLPTFKANVVATYGTSLTNVNSLFSVGMNAGDVVISFEIMKLTRKPIAEVIRVYKVSKTKGWGVMAKELGIKPGSKEFHAMKDACGKNKDKVNKKKAAPAKQTPVKTTPKTTGNGKSNGNGNGKKK
jgi:hypothetical protein